MFKPSMIDLVLHLNNIEIQDLIEEIFYFWK